MINIPKSIKIKGVYNGEDSSMILNFFQCPECEQWTIGFDIIGFNEINEKVQGNFFKGYTKYETLEEAAETSQKLIEILGWQSEQEVQVYPLGREFYAVPLEHFKKNETKKLPKVKSN